MKLSELGEFKLIEHIKSFQKVRLPSEVEGIGDDCAIIPIDQKRSSLVTTDLLLEDRHFIKASISARDLGYKTLAVNLSDIAAMGGVPKYLFLSLGLPQDLEIQWLDEFFLGFYELASKHNVGLLGGDTTQSINGIILNVLVIGEMESAQIKRRSTAQVGDTICTTGFLGDSAAGLKAILGGANQNPTWQRLIHEHHRPRPHVEEGRWLSERSAATAMMDVSDGLASDIVRIQEASRCGAQIEMNQLPLSPDFLEFCQQENFDPHELAVSGGEDYCLLVTIRSKEFEEISHDFNQHFGRPLFPIGKITPGPQGLEFYKDGVKLKNSPQGFDHFIRKI